MKTFKHIFVAIASIASVALFYSCSQDILDDDFVNEPVQTSIKAHHDGEEGLTKATFDGTDIQWDENDALSVFPAGSSSSVKFTKESGASNSFIAAGEIDLHSIYALYPYSSSASISDGTISTVIKTTQTATPGSFAPDANVAVGYSADGNEVYFKNAVSYIKISYKTTVSDVSIQKLTFKSLDESVKLSGNVALTATLSDDRVSDVATSVVSGGQDYVELVGDLQPNTDYYLVVAPVELTGGFMVTFTDANGNQFSRSYTEDKNKAQLLRNNIAPTGIKNLDNYEVEVEAYWRVKSADEFTGNNDKYLLVKNTTASSTGYRVFDENETDVFISSGAPLMDKFAIPNYSSGGASAHLWELISLKGDLSSWQRGNAAPKMLRHYVLYSFRQAYTDDGLSFGSSASEFLFNAEDAFSISVNNSSNENTGLEMSVKLNYVYNSAAQSMDVTLTNCYLELDTDDSFKLCGKITQETIDDLVTVFFLGKGDDFNSVVTPGDLKLGADSAVNEYTTIGFCTTLNTTVDGTQINNCFMIKNSRLCNIPEPESIWIYKKGIKPMSFIDYMSL